MARPVVSDALWALVEPLLPPPRPHPKGGRPANPHRAALTETLPSSTAVDEGDLLEFARSHGTTCFHFCGAARMGPAADRTAVVDDELRVHGIAGLWVADSSIMPMIVSANTVATTMMIAEKAADLIRGRAALAAAA